MTSNKDLTSAEIERLRESARRIDDALHAKLDVSELTEWEGVIWQEMFARAMDRPGPNEEAFFEDMRRKGQGVGLDEHGNLVEALPEGGTRIIQRQGEIAQETDGFKRAFKEARGKVDPGTDLSS
tara:strand:- start:868 stop:1242 length:375 start_codon:yes stop_codon:yes gene_type:complete